METKNNIIHYKNKAEYLNKAPHKLAAKVNSAKLARGVKEGVLPASDVKITEQAKDLVQNVKDVPKKIENKAKETVSAGKNLLSGASNILKKTLKTPGLTTLMPDLGVKKIEKSQNIQAKENEVLNQPAIFFIKGYEINIFSDETGLSEMSENIPRSVNFSWDDKEEILDRIQKTDVSQPIILVGHGMGGDSAVEVSNILNTMENGFRKIDLLVTLDSTGFENDIIPQNVSENLNIISDEGSLFNDGPNMARNFLKTKVYNALSSESPSDIDDSPEVQFQVFERINKVLGDAVKKRNQHNLQIKKLIDKSLSS